MLRSKLLFRRWDVLSLFHRPSWERRCFLPTQRQFTFEGSPLNMKGTGSAITREILRSTLVNGEPFEIHAITGYISTLFLCVYPERKQCLLLDAGTLRDAHRVQFYMQLMDKEQEKASSSTTTSCFSSSKKEETEEKADSHVPLKKTDESEKMQLEMSNTDNKSLTLALVVCTHCHVDHLGSAPFFALHCDTDILVADRFLDYCAGFRGRLQFVLDCFMSQLVAFRLGRHLEFALFRTIFVSENVFRSSRQRKLPAECCVLKDHQFLPLGFEDWVSIHIPGHTAHMICLYHPQTHILYGADLLVAHKNQFRVPMPVDIEYALNHTIHRLRKLPVRFLLLAHGGILDVGEVGGWDFILDELVQHQRKVHTNVYVRVLLKFFCGFNPEPHSFTRDRLPHGPLPQAAEDPPPIFWLR